MNWILLSLFWVTLTEAYNYRGQAPPYFRYRYHNAETNVSPVQHYTGNRRTNPDRSHEAQSHDRIMERSADKTNERPMNERSISLNSGSQRVQEQERRLQARIDEVFPRTENGSYKIMNYPSISSRIGQKEEEKPYADSVVFPGPTSRSSVFVPEVPKDCEQMGICENIPNYPHDIVNAILKKLGDKKKMFHHVDELDVPEIVQRLGGPPEENYELCSFREELVGPQAAQNKDGNWYFILNQKDDPIQKFRVEVCRKKDTPCDDIAIFQRGYTSACRQKFVYRTMAAVDVHTQEIVYNMSFRVPSCCSCIATHVGKK